MENPFFTRMNLSYVRVIMVIMCIPVVVLLCQAMMEQLLVLKYLLSYARGRLWPRPVVLGIKCHHFPRSRLQWHLPGTKSPQVWLLGARACAEPEG
jgi:hypothetical protein